MNHLNELTFKIWCMSKTRGDTECCDAAVEARFTPDGPHAAIGLCPVIRASLNAN